MKETQTPKNSDIIKNVNNLYMKWIIDDEDAVRQSKTLNSITFRNKQNPQILFNSDKTYQFDYYNTETKIQVKETGKWDLNTETRMMKFIPDRPVLRVIDLNDVPVQVVTYSYRVIKLTEEYLVFGANVLQTVYTVNSEGVSVARKQFVEESLFLEDDD